MTEKEKNRLLVPETSNDVDNADDTNAGEVYSPGFGSAIIVLISDDDVRR